MIRKLKSAIFGRPIQKHHDVPLPVVGPAAVVPPLGVPGPVRASVLVVVQGPPRPDRPPERVQAGHTVVRIREQGAVSGEVTIRVPLKESSKLFGTNYFVYNFDWCYRIYRRNSVLYTYTVCILYYDDYSLI